MFGGLLVAIVGLNVTFRAPFAGAERGVDEIKGVLSEDEEAIVPDPGLT